MKSPLNSNSNNYLVIEHLLNRPPYPEEIKLINSINQKFPKKDLYFDISPNKIQFFYNAIDLNKLNTLLEEFYTKTNLHSRYATNDEKDPFTSILNTLDENRSYGIRGRKRLYVDYNAERKVLNRKEKTVKRSSYYYAINDNFNPINNQYPEEYENRIICGDSEEILKKLPDNCIDLVFTSPPYNFGLGYDIGEDGIHWEEYFDKLFLIFDECIRVLKYGGRIAVNVQPLFSDYIPSHHIIANYFMQRKMIWKGEILWEKNNYNCKYTAWGSWKSPSSPYLKYTWEFIEVFAKGDLTKKGLTENIDITSEEFKKWVVAKWSVAPERNMKTFDHPAMFPEELVERVLKLFSYQNDIILDPFNGVGTTTVVSKKLNRKYLGIDISEEYCKKAELRIKQIL